MPDTSHPPVPLRSTLLTETSLPGDQCFFEITTIPPEFFSSKIVAPQKLRQSRAKGYVTPGCRRGNLDGYHEHNRQLPLQYYTRRRMVHGCLLIQQTNMPITRWPLPAVSGDPSIRTTLPGAVRHRAFAGSQAQPPYPCRDTDGLWPDPGGLGDGPRGRRSEPRFALRWSQGCTSASSGQIGRLALT